MRNTIFRLVLAVGIVVGLLAGPLATQAIYPYDNYYYGSAPTLSQSSVSVNVGQSADVTIYGGSGSYTMYTNTPNVFQSAIAGDTLTVLGLANGTGTLSVCSSGGLGSGCASLNITVGYNAYPTPYPYPAYTPYPTYNQITFSQSSINLNFGQSANVTIYGGSGGSYYLAYNSNSNGIQASLSGSTLYLNALSVYTGSNNVVVICTASTNCAALTVTVGNQTQPGGQNWAYCASENSYCNFSGTQTVRYGANGVYYYRTLSNGTYCNNSIFGDPAFGQVKQCAYGGTYGY